MAAPVPSGSSHTATAATGTGESSSTSVVVLAQHMYVQVDDCAVLFFLPDAFGTVKHAESLSANLSKVRHQNVEPHVFLHVLHFYFFT